MFKLKYHIPITAAALLALAACGSGSDNGADPAATVKSLGNAAQTSLAKKADTPEASAAEGTAAPADAAAPAADGAAAPAPADATVVNAVAAAPPAAAAALENNPSAAAQAAEATAPVTPQAEAAGTPPINSAGVRGDVVLSMMDHYSCNLQYQASGPNGGARNDGYPSIQASNAFHSGGWAGFLPNYKRVPDSFSPNPDATCDPKYYTYSAIAPGTYKLHDNQERTNHSIRGINPPAAHSFNHWMGELDVTVTEDGFSMGANVKGSAYLGHNNSGKPLVGQDQEVALQSAAPFSTKFNARIPYGVLSAWKDAQGHNYQLMLLPGETGEARLCWNVNIDIVKRLSCTTWSASQNWKRGDALERRVQYLIDDRSVYGEQGLIYFNDRQSQ